MVVIVVKLLIFSGSINTTRVRLIAIHMKKVVVYLSTRYSRLSVVSIRLETLEVSIIPTQDAVIAHLR